jgi:hypothetical protein
VLVDDRSALAVMAHPRHQVFEPTPLAAAHAFPVCRRS